MVSDLIGLLLVRQDEVIALGVVRSTGWADTFGGITVEEHRLALLTEPPVRLNRIRRPRFAAHPKGDETHNWKTGNRSAST